jgi:hypothetical protein
VTVLGDANRLHPARGDDRHELEPAVRTDAQARDPIAAGIDRDYIATVTRDLKRALRREPRSRAGSPRVERRTGEGSELSVGLAGEGGDRVVAGGVVVDVHVSGVARR